MVNRFHAIPVVKEDELVGIVTTYDIIRTLAGENVSPGQILESKRTDWEK
jgi:CBS domain-containing protein